MRRAVFVSTNFMYTLLNAAWSKPLFQCLDGSLIVENAARIIMLPFGVQDVMRMVVRFDSRQTVQTITIIRITLAMEERKWFKPFRNGLNKSYIKKFDDLSILQPQLLDSLNLP